VSVCIGEHQQCFIECVMWHRQAVSSVAKKVISHEIVQREDQEEIREGVRAVMLYYHNLCSVINSTSKFRLRSYLTWKVELLLLLTHSYMSAKLQRSTCDFLN